MARILLSAYACEPGRGSEPGVGWSWAMETARLGHQVWVLTRANNRTVIEQQPVSRATNLKFLYYDLPPQMLRWRALYGKRLYYILWQWNAVRYVRGLFPSLPFDRVHHVSYASLRMPSFMWKLGIPFWFGPVSGGESVPARLRRGFSFRQRCRERLREISNALVRVDPMMRAVFSRAEKLLVTRDTLSLVPKRWRHKCITSLAIGVASSEKDVTLQGIAEPSTPTRNPLPEYAGSPQSSLPGRTLDGGSGVFRLLFVGRLLEWKGADIALHAIRQLREKCPNVRLTIVGDGPAKPQLLKLAKELQLFDVIQWRPWLPQHALAQLYRDADVFLYPSLRDSGAMVVLEAMSHGLPVVSTDLGGPGVLVNNWCGTVVPTGQRNREQLASSFAEALAELSALPNLRKLLGQRARRRAQELRFEKLVGSACPAMPPAVFAHA